MTSSSPSLPPLLASEVIAQAEEDLGVVWEAYAIALDIKEKEKEKERLEMLAQQQRQQVRQRSL